MKKCIITVVGKDSVGIIAKVCTYLAETNINILNISQTIVDGYFNMMAVTDVENSKKELDIVAVELRDIGLQIGVNIHCQREEIFEKMHRVVRRTAMINFYEVVETNQMIEEENLDVRTITLGISLMDCIDSDLDRLNEKIYKKSQHLQGILYRQERRSKVNLEFRSLTSGFPLHRLHLLAVQLQKTRGFCDDRRDTG